MVSGVLTHWALRGGQDKLELVAGGGGQCPDSRLHGGAGGGQRPAPPDPFLGSVPKPELMPLRLARTVPALCQPEACW